MQLRLREVPGPLQAAFRQTIARIPGMASLVTPDVRFRASWLAAQAEFAGANMDGSGVFEDSRSEDIAADFPAFVRGLVEDQYPSTPRPEGWVPCTYLWLVEGEEFLGSVAIRHTLTEYLFEEGGHVGYSIRPSARRQGHATRALRDAVPVARRLGIDRLLVTCAEDNAGSRAVIERNGGVYEDTREGTRRYWI